MTQQHIPDEGDRAPVDATPGPDSAAAEPAEPAQPAQPAEPSEGAGPAAPDEPADPTGPAGPTDPGEGGSPEDPLAAAQAAVAALTSDLQRLQAEYVNYKRRVDRDRELVLQNAKFTVLSALMPVLDDVDRAREHGELEGGFKAVAEALERAVAAQGLVKFGSSGDEFDPRLHEALMHSHSADVTTTTCQHIVNAGYKIGDRVVRPAKVTVVDPEPAGASTGKTAEDDPVVS